MRKRNKLYRLLTQLLFLMIIVLVTVFSVTEASLHAFCPFGGVETLYQFVSTGDFIQKIHNSAFILMFIFLFIALLFGGVFCGWICPFGTIQELVSRVGKKIFKKRFNRFIPYKVDKYLRYGRYLVLFWVLYMTITTAKLFFDDYDPYSALFHLWTSEVSITGIIILGVIIALSLFVERPWCKYACPYGAVLGIFNVFSIFKIKRNESSCISCSKCDKVCPMNIKISDKKKIINHQCIRCLKCSSDESCPIVNTVELRGGLK